MPPPKRKYPRLDDNDPEIEEFDRPSIRDEDDPERRQNDAEESDAFRFPPRGADGWQGPDE